MGLSKYLMLLLLVLAFVAVLWVFGKSVFTGVTRWVLWALGALCAFAGVVAISEAEGRPLAFLGGFILWVFAAYSIKVAESLRKRS